MLNFDISPHIVCGFSLHWCWVWLMFWSSLFYAVNPAIPQDGYPLLSLEPLWNCSFAGLLIALVVLFFVGRKVSPLAARPGFALVAGVITGVGTLLVSQASLLLVPQVFGVVYGAGAFLTGVGSAMEVALWGELLVRLGSRQTVVYFVSATIMSALIYPMVMALPAVAGQLLTAVLPVAEMLFFIGQAKRRASAVQDAVRVEREVGSRSLETAEGEGFSIGCKGLYGAFGKIFSLSLLFGLSYGIMKGLFTMSSQELIGIRDLINVVALIIGSAAVFLTTAIYKMDFCRLTYQVALPLLAMGFLLFPLPGVANLVGFGFHQVGYQYFYTIIWAMWPVFAQRFEAPDVQFACSGMLGVQSGQFFGSIIGSSIMQFVTSSYMLAMVSALLIFLILLVSAFGFGNVSSSNWLLFRPFGQEQDNVPTFRRSVSRIGKSRGLTPREMDVLNLLVRGRNKKFISDNLVISEGTVKSHIRNIYRKLGVHSQQALIDLVELDAKSK